MFQHFDSLRMTRSAAAALLFVLGACGGGGGGGGSSSAPIPADAGALPHALGLTSIAAGNGTVQVRWDARTTDGAAANIAIFRSTSSATLYQGAPFATASGAGSNVVASGLVNGTTYFFGLAVANGAGWQPSGAVFTATPRAPVFVDATSTALAPDGASAASAFPTLAAGLAAVIAAGGGNVWIAEGTYDTTSLSIPAGVALQGGFAHDFALATRDPAAHVTRVRGSAGLFVLEIFGGGGSAALDGLVVDANHAASFGVDVDSTDAQLGALIVESTASHGVRLRDTSSVGAVRVEIAGSWVRGAAGEGLSLAGTFKLGLSGSRFSANAREGVSLGQLVAKNGINATLHVRDCAFVSNGEDGLDCQLGSPPVIAGSSSFAVTIERTSFEENGWNSGGLPTGGLRLDIDYELVPNWTADIVVRGCTARANRGDGILLDLDAASTTLLHRVLASGNAGDGLRVSSETASALAVASNSAFTGNLGAGARVLLGNVPLAATHCIFGGNAQGGLLSTSVTSTATSSIAWLGGTPYSGARAHFSASVADELTPVFTNVPLEYQRVASFDGTDIVLASASSFAAGDRVEIGDDGVARTIDSVLGPTRFHVTPVPVSLALPASIARFAGAASVVEDYSPAAGSIVVSGGMPAPAGPAPDAGPAGGPLAGAPGVEAGVLADLFRVAASTPATNVALGASTPIVFSFRGGTLSAASIANQVRVRNAAGALLVVATSAAAGNLTVQAPAGGWPSGDVVVELHAGLAATSGATLAAPVALTFRRP